MALLLYFNHEKTSVDRIFEYTTLEFLENKTKQNNLAMMYYSSYIFLELICWYFSLLVFNCIQEWVWPLVFFKPDVLIKIWNNGYSDLFKN